MKKLLDVKISEPETIKEDNSYASKYFQIAILPYEDRLDSHELEIDTLNDQMLLVRDILKSDHNACVQCQSLKRVGIVLFAFSSILNAMVLYRSF